MGLLSDGDLRRLLEKEGASALAKTAGEAMRRDPLTIAANEFAAEALRHMEERKITSLIVVDDEAGSRVYPPARPVGNGIVLKPVHATGGASVEMVGTTSPNEPHRLKPRLRGFSAPD